MTGVKGFYGKRTQHRFSSDAVNQIQDDDALATIAVIIRPPTSGQDRLGE